MSQFIPEEKTYTIPQAGMYQITARIMRAIPTGRYETVPNPDRRFWEFWKPRWVTRQIYRYDTSPEGIQVIRLNPGDRVESAMEPRRL